MGKAKSSVAGLIAGGGQTGTRNYYRLNKETVHLNNHSRSVFFNDQNDPGEQFQVCVAEFSTLTPQLRAWQEPALTPTRAGKSCVQNKRRKHGHLPPRPEIRKEAVQAVSESEGSLTPTCSETVLGKTLQS